MITLHHCVSARLFRPLWMLEELGLPYTLRMLPFPSRAVAAHNAETLVAALNMSSRSLHRQLQEEGAERQQLKDEVKFEKAKELLRCTSKPISRWQRLWALGFGLWALGFGLWERDEFYSSVSEVDGNTPTFFRLT